MASSVNSQILTDKLSMPAARPAVLIHAVYFNADLLSGRHCQYTSYHFAYPWWWSGWVILGGYL